MAKLVPIPREDLPRMLGCKIHLKWASRGCVWRLEEIDGDKIVCHTPKTYRRMIARAEDACYTRGHEPRQEAGHDDR